MTGVGARPRHHRGRAGSASARVGAMTRVGAAVLAAMVLVGAGAALAWPATAASQPNVVGTSIYSPAQVQSRQWWITRLNLRKAWRITRGKGVTVAVIDTGVDPRFGDLHGALVPGFNVDVHATGDTDPAYHGTRIADEIAGRGSGFGLLGVAPQAKILPIATSDTDSAPVAAALNHLTAMSSPPQVVNMSFGGPFPCPGGVAAATRRAARAGIILVAGAGNSAQTGNLSQYPANCPGVVAVGAVNNDARSWPGSQRRSYVTLAGPGVHIIGYDANDKSGIGYSDGTSDASAVVAGIMALMRAHFPSMSARDIVTTVLGTARQFGGTKGTRNNRYGYGVALPYNALTRHVAPDSPDPVYAGLDATGAPSSTPPAPGSSGSGTPAPQSDSGPSAPASDATSSAPAAAPDSAGGTSPGLVVGIVVVIIVVVGIVVAVTLRGRRRAVGRGHGPPGGGP